MKKIAFALVSIFIVLNVAHALELQNGDVLLISFNCYECRVIESETNSKFSHSGVIIKNEAHEIRVGQSLGFVALYPLDQFLKNKTPGTSVSVYRPKEFLNLKDLDRTSLEERMLSVFNSSFKGAPFDVKYLWDNFDENGRELLYCSEFIAKFLDHFLGVATVPFPLTYKKNEAYWSQYFHGMIPEGVLGNSPASFSHDERFAFVGNL
ncbi:MAG: YiiX/YebB-like N1pC/P60 family cysteine hydrolase [Bacteriovorax sp.]